MKLILFLIALILNFTAIAQDDNTIFSVIQVTESFTDNKEDTYSSLENERYILFDYSENKIDFINVVKVNKSYSIGKLTNIKTKKINQYQMIYYFDWNYSNSYNDVKGVAKVKLEINKKYGEQEYDQAIVTITDSKGLNILYKGNLVHYKNEFTFHDNFKKVIGN